MSGHLAGLEARSRREGEFDDTRSPSNLRNPTVDRTKWGDEIAASSEEENEITQPRLLIVLRCKNDDLVIATFISSSCSRW